MSAAIEALGSPRSSVSETQGNPAMGKDQFVKLLMAQLANQDPTAPMDSEAFVAQLAQFATVEILQDQSSSLNALLMAQAASNQTAVASLVGRKVAFRSEGLELATIGAPTTIQARLSAPVDQITVTIKDDSGRVVRTLRLDGQAQNEFTTVWDGLDDSGNPVPAGKYTLGVAASMKGEAVDSFTVREALVDGVSYESGVPQLLFGNEHISLGEVLEVRRV